MDMMIVQNVVSVSNVVGKYYEILSVVNNLHLTPRDVQLLVFIASKGSLVNKQEFYSLCNTTSATVNNSISKLKKLGMLVKPNKEIVINPLISPKFENGIDLHLQLRWYE